MISRAETCYFSPGGMKLNRRWSKENNFLRYIHNKGKIYQKTIRKKKNVQIKNAYYNEDDIFKWKKKNEWKENGADEFFLSASISYCNVKSRISLIIVWELYLVYGMYIDTFFYVLCHLRVWANTANIIFMSFLVLNIYCPFYSFSCYTVHKHKFVKYDVLLYFALLGVSMSSAC